MQLADSWADLVRTLVAAGGVPVALWTWRQREKQKRLEYVDKLAAQARQVSVSVEPAYGVGTSISPRIVGGLTKIKWVIANDSERHIRHVDLDITLPWAPKLAKRFTYDRLKPGEESGVWAMDTTTPLPRGQNQLGRDDVRAAITFMDATGLWWRVSRTNPEPERLPGPTIGAAPEFRPWPVRAIFGQAAGASAAEPRREHVDDPR